MKFNLKSIPHCLKCERLEVFNETPIGCDWDITNKDSYLCPKMEEWFEGFEKELRQRIRNNEETIADVSIYHEERQSYEARIKLLKEILGE